jgi:DNA-binding CsgD family transcriptional regulator
VEETQEVGGVATKRSESFPALVDAIYEAAFFPEGWNDLLAQVGAASGSAAGLLMVFDGARPLGFRATPVVHDIIEAAATSLGRPNERAAFALKNPFRGFVRFNDYLPPAILNSDPGHARRLALGLESEASSVTVMPTGELVVFSFDRWTREGPHRQQHLAALNALYPHLARTALVAARLRLDRASTAAMTLQMIGLPAAVLTNSGRLLSSNASFDQLASLFLPSAFGRVVIADPRAHRLLQEALDPTSGTIRSIPIAETEGRRPCVLHVLPLRRNAHDIFSGGDMLIAVTTLSASSASPSAAVLESLFDLTQSEVSFTTALMEGLTVQEAARKCGLTESSGRTYLGRIFAKTGTHRQSELITLLSSTHPLSSGNDHVGDRRV